jgi:hypothetical protein
VAQMPGISIPITTSPAELIRMIRIIAKHLTALADELETPDMIIKGEDDLTDEQVTELKQRFLSYYPPRSSQ